MRILPHPTSLSAFQAAKLASMVPNPRYYNKHRDACGLMKKTGIIMARMNDSDILQPDFQGYSESEKFCMLTDHVTI